MGVPGQKGGMKGRSGRKSKSHERGLTLTLDRCVTQKERERLFADLKREAFAGDKESRALLLAYIYGKPKQAIDVDQDGEIVLKVIYGNDGIDS